MKSKQTRKRNSRRKPRMSRKHHGGDLSTPSNSTTNTLSQNELAAIEQGMRAESEKMIQEIGLEQTIQQLEELIKINKKDNSANKIINIPGQTKEAAKNFTEDLITLQKKLLAELKMKSQH
jgi:capsular polysaccharide biosynthesis protein